MLTKMLSKSIFHSFIVVKFRVLQGRPELERRRRLLLCFSSLPEAEHRHARRSRYRPAFESSHRIGAPSKPSVEAAAVVVLCSASSPPRAAHLRQSTTRATRQSRRATPLWPLAAVALPCFLCLPPLSVRHLLLSSLPLPPFSRQEAMEAPEPWPWLPPPLAPWPLASLPPSPSLSLLLALVDCTEGKG